VAIDLIGSNRTFFFPRVPIRYAVRVTDREDGSLQSGRIPASRVMVTAEYRRDGVVPERIGHQPVAAATSNETGRRLIEGGTCLSCHQVNKASVGPAYMAVARRYRGDAGARARLVRKIREGGSGVWGQVMMPGHPQVTEGQASAMVAYILGLGRPSSASLPVRGSYTPAAATDSSPQGIVVLRATYTDRGANTIRGTSDDTTVVLRAPVVIVAKGDVADGIGRYAGPEVPVEVTIANRTGSFVGFKRLDLTGVVAITFMATAPVPNVGSAGGKIEVRLDSASGPLIGETRVIQPQDSMGPPARLRATLRPTAGMRDVYFVFRNDEAKAGQNLFVVFTAHFERSRPPTRRSP
jgi:cytochrome c